MLYVVNYADGEPYESFRRANTKTALLFGGADKVFEYSSENIPSEYKHKYSKIFTYKRGAGLWLWKPYIILDALSKIKDNDWLFYCDSGAVFIDNLRKMVSCAIENHTDILLVEQPMLNRQFCKRESFIRMNVTDSSENQLLSGYILLQKSEWSLKFIQEWQKWCEVEEIISPNHFDSDVVEWPDFYSHREDQSILTLLSIKYGLVPFRDPSDYGLMPYMYSSPDWRYCPKKYPNSTYPTIVLCSRTINPLIYAIKFFFKRILIKLGIYYTEKQVLKKRGVTYENCNI